MRPLNFFDRRGMIRDRTAQSAVWGLLAILILVLVASGLVDIYRLYAVRNWAYSVAQEAAMTGASRGRDWSAVTSSAEIRLDAARAQNEASQIVSTEMSARGISGYTADIRVLPNPGGGEMTDFPPVPVRLGLGRGSWSSNQPAVGVYVSLPVNWLILDRLGILSKTVDVFASAGVAE
jgi:hypothetical protein